MKWKFFLILMKEQKKKNKSQFCLTIVAYWLPITSNEKLLFPSPCRVHFFLGLLYEYISFFGCFTRALSQVSPFQTFFVRINLPSFDKENPIRWNVADGLWYLEMKAAQKGINLQKLDKYKIKKNCNVKLRKKISINSNEYFLKYRFNPHYT